MREINTHQVPGNGLNEELRITVLDNPGPGNANHNYRIASYDDRFQGSCDIHFQNGPIKEAGLNGISNEALLAVVIDRLQGFQSGDYKCRENALAITHLEDAMHWLQHRTLERMRRGVEGTMQK